MRGRSVLKRVSRARKRGLPPGSAVYTGTSPVAPPVMTLTTFGPGAGRSGAREVRRGVTETDLPPPPPGPGGTNWLSVAGVSDAAAIARIGAALSLHPLVVEDLVNVGQRPKAERYEGYVYAVVRLVRCGLTPFEPVVEQVSVIVRDDLVVTFEEGPPDASDLVSSRLGTDDRRRITPDYLLYVVVDRVVDEMFGVLEKMSEGLEELETEVVTRPEPDVLPRIFTAKRAMLQLRRSVWPLRELLSSLERQGTLSLTDETRLHLRDTYDHVVEIVDVLETSREMASGLLDVYLSSSGNRMNAVMKVLTAVTTIFMPLGFIAGVYGMNFEHMPELHSRAGYPAVLLLMATVAGTMTVYFRRKGWF